MAPSAPVRRPGLDTREKLAILGDAAKYGGNKEQEYARFVDDLRRIGERAKALT